MKPGLFILSIVLLIALGVSTCTSRLVEAAVLTVVITVLAYLVMLVVMVRDVTREVRLAWLGRLWAKRRRQNQCLTCGYDLRGTPERCPECGTPGPTPLAKQGGT